MSDLTDNIMEKLLSTVEDIDEVEIEDWDEEGTHRFEYIGNNPAFDKYCSSGIIIDTDEENAITLVKGNKPISSYLQFSLTSINEIGEAELDEVGNILYITELNSEDATERIDRAFNELNRILIDGEVCKGIYFSTPDIEVNTWNPINGALSMNEEEDMGFNNPYNLFYGSDEEYTEKQQKIRKAIRKICTNNFKIVDDLEELYKSIEEKVRASINLQESLADMPDMVKLFDINEEKLVECEIMHKVNSELHTRIMNKLSSIKEEAEKELGSEIIRFDVATVVDERNNKLTYIIYISSWNNKVKEIDFETDLD